LEDKKMEMTFSRKFLNIAGILDYIMGSLTLLLGILVTGAGIYVIKTPELLQEMPSYFGDYTVIIFGAILAVSAILSLVYAHLERAAAKDPTKIMPVWVLSILSVAMSVGSIICNLVQHVAIADMGSSLVGLAISILMLFVANNIKKEAGK
jgi:membrane associated rhomboid family serine protease